MPSVALGVPSGFIWRSGACALRQVRKIDRAVVSVVPGTRSLLGNDAARGRATSWETQLRL